MRVQYLLPTLAVGTTLASHAHAHGFAGDHMFIRTLLIDDPNVADEASLPTFSFLPQLSDGGSAPAAYGLRFELDKRISESFEFAFDSGFLVDPNGCLRAVHRPGTAGGWHSKDELAAPIRGICANPIIQSSESQHEHHH